MAFIGWFDHENRFSKSPAKTKIVKQHLPVVSPVEMETADENDVFAPVDMTCLQCHLLHRGAIAGCNNTDCPEYNASEHDAI